MQTICGGASDRGSLGFGCPRPPSRHLSSMRPPKPSAHRTGGFHACGQGGCQDERWRQRCRGVAGAMGLEPAIVTPQIEIRL